MKHFHFNQKDISFRNRLKVLAIQIMYLIVILVPLFSIKVISYANEEIFSKINVDILSNLFLLYIVCLISLSLFFVIFWKSYSRFSNNLKFNLTKYYFLRATVFYYFFYSLVFTSGENFFEDMKTFFYSLF